MSGPGSGVMGISPFCPRLRLFLIPVSGWIGGVGDFGAILSGVVLIGLLESA
jgi:hypothetical protein